MACEPEYNYDGTILKRLPEEYDGTFKVPEGVKEIAPDAFMHCQLLSTISLPSTLTKIGERHVRSTFAMEMQFLRRLMANPALRGFS